MVKLDDETRSNIEKALRRKNGMPKTKIAKKYGVSISTVSRISDSLGLTKKKTAKKEDEKTANPERYRGGGNSMECPIVISVGNKRKDFEVGLIADRHDMPVDVYIFPKPMNPGNMFDYEFMDSTVQNFITNNLYENGQPTKNMVLYTTGLTAATSSVIKICSKLQINLVIKHFNISTRDYESQVVFKDFGKDAVSSIFPCANDKIYFHDLDLNYINNIYGTKISLYIIKDINRNAEKYSKVSIHIFKDKDAAKEEYKKLVVESCIDKVPEKKCIVLEYGDISKRCVYRKTNNLARCYNFDNY